MALRKKSINAIAKALVKVDDKAEFGAYEHPIDETLPLSAVSAVTIPEPEKEELTINDFAKLFNSEDEEGFLALTRDESIGSNVITILRKITLGLLDWEYKFLAAYTLVPSIFCRILPICEIYGQAGTGKSQLLIAMSKISSNGIISGQSTGASLKNHINMIRWADPETKNTEKNCLLLIDNLNEDSFKKEEYLSSFLNGYNRNTDRTFISNGKGENIEFRTFCGKIYTTIWDRNSTELARRTITIKTQKVEHLEELLDPEDIFWSPLSFAVKEFWVNSENWNKYQKIHKSYAKTQKPSNNKEYWTLLKDTLVAGVVAGVWTDLESAITETSSWLEKALKTRHTLTEVIILQAVEGILGIPSTDWQEMSQRLKIHVSPRQLKDAIEKAVKDGLIDRPKLSIVQQVLAKLGFVPGKKDNQLGYTYKGKVKK